MASSIAAPVLAIAGGALGHLSATNANDAASEQARAARKAANTSMRQILDRARQERELVSRRTQQIQSRVRVLAGARGDSTTSGTTLRTLRGLDTERAINEGVIKRNTTYQLDRVQNSLQADLAQIGSLHQNPFLSTVNGILQGVTSGLQIGQGIDELFTAPKPPSLPPTPTFEPGPTP